ncbi:MAG: hypothetical protein GSR86_03640 [Desulfurococcales archaeon]|nr:hypothetical protein [Desulfurococcales archaeon]
MDTVEMVIGSRADVDEYVLRIIVEFNRGVRRVRLKAFNDNICKLADVYASLKERLGDSVSIVEGRTGARRDRGRRKIYMDILVEYSPV